MLEDATAPAVSRRIEMPDLGELAKVDLREMWANEAYNFTPWLAGNIEKLVSVP